MLVAVTGANGFIAKHLCQELKSHGFSLKRIQRKSSLEEDVVQIENIDSRTDWSKVLSNVDVIVHCASLVHQPESISSKVTEKYYEINSYGTKNLAEQAAEIGVKRFIFISSIKVNGETTNINYPFDQYSKPSPKDAYSQSKLLAEDYLLEISAKTGLEVVIIRPPLVYGPGVGANFKKLLALIYKGYPLPFGKFKNRRSLIFVGNLVSFITRCIQSEKAVGKILLVSDNETISTKDLIRSLAKAMQKRSLIFNLPLYILLFIAFILGKRSQLRRLSDSLEIDPKYSYSSLEWLPPYDYKTAFAITANWYLNSMKRDLLIK